MPVASARGDAHKELYHEVFSVSAILA